MSQIFFQLTVKDAEELAPEFAKLVEATEERRKAELVLSPHPVEDIWEKGHPNKYMSFVRSKYFWTVELLRQHPNEKYFLFDPFRLPADYYNPNKGNLPWHDFTDWDMYRSSADMLRQGISLLDQYYYDWMQHEYARENLISDVQLELMLKVVECFGGLFGFRPTMMPYIPEEMRLLYVRRMEELRGRNVEKAYGNIEDALRYNGLQPGTSAYFNEHARLSLALKRDPIYTKPTALSDIPGDLIVKIVPQLRQAALVIGFSPHELEQFIQWKVRPLHPLEAQPLAEMVKIVANMSNDRKTYSREQNRIYHAYTAIMAKQVLEMRFGESYQALSDAGVKPYLQIVTERIVWQMTELQAFIQWCFVGSPSGLEDEPIKVSSGKYDESLKVERTQQDLINEMAMELSSLPRFTAYAKAIEERKGTQLVWKRRIQTLPLPPERRARGVDSETMALENSHRFCKERDQIEEEIRKRQEPWRNGRGSGQPPSQQRRKPPPTSE
jgi:hypothetical protein